jgi:hypothetical protein
VRTPIDELLDSREPQVLAGIVSDFRVINGQRGQAGLVQAGRQVGRDRGAADEACSTHLPQPAQGRRGWMAQADEGRAAVVYE